jgi:Tol biopolymer transport system component
MTGWNTSGDSLLLYEISFPGGEITRLTAFFGESENAMWLADGSILVAVQESLGMATLYRVKGRNLVERVGAVSRRIGARGRVTASADGRRLGIVTHQYDGDIWLAKVGLTR